MSEPASHDTQDVSKLPRGSAHLRWRPSWPRNTLRESEHLERSYGMNNSSIHIHICIYIILIFSLYTIYYLYYKDYRHKQYALCIEHIHTRHSLGLYKMYIQMLKFWFCFSGSGSCTIHAFGYVLAKSRWAVLAQRSNMVACEEADCFWAGPRSFNGNQHLFRFPPIAFGNNYSIWFVKLSMTNNHKETRFGKCQCFNVCNSACN